MGVAWDRGQNAVGSQVLQVRGEGWNVGKTREGGVRGGGGGEMKGRVMGGRFRTRRGVGSRGQAEAWVSLPAEATAICGTCCGERHRQQRRQQKQQQRPGTGSSGSRGRCSGSNRGVLQLAIGSSCEVVGSGGMWQQRQQL